jgi:hypothetical protein
MAVAIFVGRYVPLGKLAGCTIHVIITQTAFTDCLTIHIEAKHMDGISIFKWQENG